MKRTVAILLVLLSVLLFCACGGNDVTVTTVSELDGCKLTTVYYFDDSDKLTAVKQTAVYTDTSAMTYDYSLIEAMVDNYFTDIEKTDDTIKLTLTEKGMNETYPDATYSSIIEMAKSQGVEVETSK